MKNKIFWRSNNKLKCVHLARVYHLICLNKLTVCLHFCFIWLSQWHAFHAIYRNYYKYQFIIKFSTCLFTRMRKFSKEQIYGIILYKFEAQNKHKRRKCADKFRILLLFFKLFLSKKMLFSKIQPKKILLSWLYILCETYLFYKTLFLSF